MADDDLATESANSPGGGASGRVRTGRLPAEQGERIAALVRELRGGRNHVAVETSTASYAGLDSGSAAHDAAALVRELRGGRNDVAVESYAASYAGLDSGTAAHDATALVRELRSGRNDVAVEASAASYAGLDSSTAAHDAVVGTPVAIVSAATPSVANCDVPVGGQKDAEQAQGAGASGRMCTLPDLPDSGLRRVADRLPAEEGERFAALVRELRGGPNHVAVEFSAATYAWLYNRTAAHDAVVGIPTEHYSASPPGVSRSAGKVAQDVPGSNSKEDEGDGIDRLSDLPNDIISDIVARLPLKEAVRTHVLSRRWLSLPALPPRRSLADVLFADMELTDSDGDEDAITIGVTLDQADRFTELPDHIICSILCRVPLVDAIRTCVLGRRWREVWTCLPCLTLDDMAVGDAGVMRFLDFVDGVLARSTDMKIQRLILNVTDPDNVDGARLAAWSAQAAESVRGPVFFKLDISADFLQGETVFEMPNQALADSITVFISHPEEIAFRVRLTANGQFASLTRLVLVGTRFKADDNGRSISDIVSKDCPVLNSLRLEDVRGVFLLHLDSASLIDLRAVLVSDLTGVELTTQSLNRIHFAYCFVGKEATTLTVSKHNLKEVVWNDTWPVHSHFGAVEMLEKLMVYRQNNPQNLKRVISQFSLTSVKTLCVSVSTDEDMQEVKTEVQSMRIPRYCVLVIQLSENEEGQ
ncbi:uncharacterized protein LOC8074680 [Sorghum bicolor]|nr:uncharacterized protein LOC8074680 [Sorghum bicolor]|eukprot:XP_021314604.1 uncharacterized protein LOC8074680 [Sorghum bicolor]